MVIPVFIGIAAILFIAGILFIVKGVSSEELEAVPISNPKEIEEFKGVFAPSRQEKPSVQGLDIQPSSEGTVPEGETSEQIRLNRLMEENQQLKKQIDERKDQCARLERNIEALRGEHRQEKDREEGKIKALEDEIARMRREKEQLLPSRELLDALKSKCESLEKRHEESRNQQTKMQAIINEIKTEKDGLLAQMEKSEERVAELLKARTPTVSTSEFDVLSNKLIESITAIETLKRENKELRQLNCNLENDFRRTEEANAHLLEKERTMQYELTRNRAQAVGLEKICEGFRRQIETMAASAAAE